VSDLATELLHAYTELADRYMAIGGDERLVLAHLDRLEPAMTLAVDGALTPDAELLEAVA
jgi:hypothetical protein